MSVKHFSSIYIFLFALFLCLPTVSCSQKDHVDYLDVDVESFDFPHNGGQRQFSIQASSDWAIDITENWCTTNLRKGSTNNTVLVTVEANKTDDVRTAQIHIRCGGSRRTINVSQGAIKLSATPRNLTAKAAGENLKLKINTDTRWWINIPINFQEWISVTPQDGKSSTEITVAIKPNKGYVRQGFLYVNTESKSIEIEINQASDIPSIPDGEIKVLKTNTKGKYPNEIIIVGDGFSARDCVPGGIFEHNVQEAMEAFMDIEPYKSYQEYFKFTRLTLYSEDSGISEKDKHKIKKTIFNTEFYDESAIRISGDNADNAVRLIAEKLNRSREQLKNTSIILICNIDRYGGVCYLYSDGVTVALCPTSRNKKHRGADFASLIHHEAGGHGFGWLCDEYVNNQGLTLPEKNKQEFQTWEKFGFYSNVDVTGNKQKAKWSHFYNLPGYSVQYIEGANCYSYGAWRPEQNSVMIDNRPYYNAPSRESIVKILLRKAAGVRISDYEYVKGAYIKKPIQNDPFNFDEFVKKDVIKSEPATMRSMIDVRPFKETRSPVFIQVNLLL